MGNIEASVKSRDLEVITTDNLSSVACDDTRVYKWFYKPSDYMIEYNAISKLNSKYIVKISEEIKVKEKSKVYLSYVMPKYQFTLRKWRNDTSYIMSGQIRNLTRQIITGLQYLHDNDICHGDIKPGNIMLHKNTIKIIDFGDAMDITEEFPKLSKAIGTEGYQAPELIIEVPHDEKIDHWSFGCLFYFIVTGSDLFDFDKIESEDEEGIENQLAEMSKLIGKVPLEFIESSSYDITLYDDRRKIGDLGLKKKYIEMLDSSLQWIPKNRSKWKKMHRILE